MKKIILAFWLMAAYALPKAQPLIHRTFDINNNGDRIYPHCNIAANVFKRIVTVSLPYGMVNGLPINYMSLTKHDVFSNSMVYELFVHSVYSTHYFAYTKALLETPDKSILIGGFYVMDGQAWPMLIKVDNHGNLLWAYRYPVNCCPIDIDDSKVSLALVEDDLEEKYFMVVNSSSDLRPQDEVINVLKIADDGYLKWSKKYYDSQFTGDYDKVREIPGDIAYSPVDNLYVITGTQQNWRDSTYHENIFFMGIDREGNIIRHFKTVLSHEMGSGGDMIYDSYNDRFAAVYTQMEPDAISPFSSKANLVVVDPSLNVVLDRSYAQSGFTINTGFSISNSVDRQHYIIGGAIYDGVPGVNGIWGQSLLKVEHNGFPAFYIRYNPEEQVLFGSHCNIEMLDANNELTEGYALASEYNSDLRTILTDINGEACDIKKYDIDMTLPDVHEKEYLYYDAMEVPVGTSLLVRTSYRHSPYYDCVQPFAKKEEGSNPTEEEQIVITNTPDKGIYISNPNGETLLLEIYSLAGELVYNTTTIGGKIDCGVLSTGMYLAHLRSKDGIVHQTGKIIVE